MLWVFNETPLSNPPVWQDIIKKGSSIVMVERGCPILMNIGLLIFTVFSNTWHDRPSQQVQVNRTSLSIVKENSPINPLDDKRQLSFYTFSGIFE